MLLHAARRVNRFRAVRAVRAVRPCGVGCLASSRHTEGLRDRGHFAAGMTTRPRSTLPYSGTDQPTTASRS